MANSHRYGLAVGLVALMATVAFLTPFSTPQSPAKGSWRHRLPKADWSNTMSPSGSFSLIPASMRSNDEAASHRMFMHQLKQEHPTSHHHILHHAEVLDVLEEPKWQPGHSSVRGSSIDGGDMSWFYVTTAGTLDSGMKAALQNIAPSMTFSHYMPLNTFIEALPASQVDALSGHDSILWINELPNSHKASPSLYNGDNIGADVGLVIDTWNPTAVAEAVSKVESLPSDVFMTMDGGHKLSIMRLGAGDAQRLFEDILMEMPEVGVVDVVPQSVDWFNLETALTLNGQQWDPSVGPMDQEIPALRARGWRGEGQIVSQMDTGIDPESCWWIDPNGHPIGPDHFKVLEIIDPDGPNGNLSDTDDDYGHGSHVAGTTLGYINDTMEAIGWVGVAPDAKLLMIDTHGHDGIWFIEQWDPWSYAMEESKQRNSFLNSWSLGNYTTDYSVWMAAVDTYLADNHDVLALISAGNGGGFISHMSIAQPSGAKNSLSMGAARTYSNATLNYYCNETLCETGFVLNRTASQNGEPNHAFGGFTERQDYSDYLSAQTIVADFSSRGPFPDGRLFPDVHAPGDFVVSAGVGYLNESTCEAVPNAGTSMSSPAAEGAATLLREWFEKGAWLTGEVTAENEATPSGVVLKTGLINSAKRMTGLAFDAFSDANLTATELGAQVADMAETYNEWGGYGLIDLSRLMFVSESADFPEWGTRSAFFWADAPNDGLLTPALATDDNWSVSFDVEAGTELSVSVCWYDPANSVNAASALVNNLDLFVSDGDGSVVCNGNDRSVTNPNPTGPSTVDPCEKCEVSFASASSVTVEVTGTSVPSGPQSFAVVINQDPDQFLVDDGGSFFDQIWQTILDFLAAYDIDPLTALVILIIILVVLILFCWCCCCRRSRPRHAAYEQKGSMEVYQPSTAA